MWLKGVGIIKFVFIAILLLIFIQYFGIVSIKKYLDRGILVKVSKQSNPDGVVSPSVTICALNPLTKNGWRNDNFTMESDGSFVEASCSGLTGRDLQDCVLRATYDIADFIPGGLDQGFNFSFDITVGRNGKCYTHTSPTESIGSTIGYSSLLMQLNNTMQFEIFVHEQNFFFLTLNPKAFPGFRISLESDDLKNGEFRLQTIEIIQRNNMDTEDQPCTNDPNYSFSVCLRKSMETTGSGCVMPWNNGENGTKMCQTVEQYENYTSAYFLLAMMELRDVVEFTKCPLPCSYRIIKPVDKPQTFPNTGDSAQVSGYGLTLASTDILVETEELIYSFSNFVSDIGGSLGLFLGFSFIMFWDWIMLSLHFLKSLFSINGKYRKH